MPIEAQCPLSLAEAATMPAMVRAAAASFSDKPAVVLRTADGAEKSLSFRQLDARSAELARGLLAWGAGKGTRIGFIFGNGPDFAVLLAAIARIGAVAIPISTLIRADELVRVLRQSDVGGLIVQRRLLGHDLGARLLDALPELRVAGDPALRMTHAPYLRWVVCSGDGLPPAIRDMDRLVAAADSVSEDLLRAVEAEVHPCDQMLEIYTSGSMAQPKGVRHNHGPAITRAHYLAVMVGRDTAVPSLVPLPMFWVGGLGLFLLANWARGITSLCSEGTATDSQAARGSVFSAEQLKARMQAKPYWGLGMTETFGPYAWGDELRAEGYPLCPPMDHIAEGYELRVVDDAGQPVPDGGRGEIQVRGDAVTPGLHKFDRSAHFTPDGFYRTGDLGVVEGSRIHFVGRGGDMIKTAKANVSPAEVEMELTRLDGVETAFVVGLPDDERGELVTAGVVAREGAVLDFGYVEAQLRQRLSPYKVPRAYVALTRDEVPMLPSNKVARRELLGMLSKRLGRIAPDPHSGE